MKPIHGFDVAVSSCLKIIRTLTTGEFEHRFVRLTLRFASCALDSTSHVGNTLLKESGSKPAQTMKDGGGE